MGELVFLVDTSLWLEILLEQDRHVDARAFLETLEPGMAVMSEFTLYSVGLILSRHGRGEDYEPFLQETLQRGSAQRVRLDLPGLESLPETMEREGLDFDDAYQHEVADRFSLDIVSLDGDFDATSQGRLSLDEALEAINSAD